jgi:hypothetical protein
MKRAPTLLLKIAVTGIGLAVLALCIFALPSAIRSEIAGDFDYGIIFVGMYIPALPFFYALFHVLRLLNLVDNNQAFSLAAAQALKRIKLCAYIIGTIYALGMPYIFYLADKDDAPGVALLGFVIIGVSFVVGTAASVLQRLVQKAVEIKTENDLTV